MVLKKQTIMYFVDYFSETCLDTALKKNVAVGRSAGIKILCFDSGGNVWMKNEKA